MRKFLEIKEGKQLKVGLADADKNLQTIKLSPVHEMHSLHLYKKQ